MSEKKIMVTELLYNYNNLIILCKIYSVGFHVQDTGDGVALGEGGKRSDQLPSVVQVATVSPIQPHVGGGVVVVISDRPA